MAWLAVLSVGVLGCLSEVPYTESEGPVASAESPGDAPEGETAPPFEALEEPAPTDRYAEADADAGTPATPTRMPWESADPEEETPAGASELFSEAVATAPEAADPDGMKGEEEVDDFEAYLGNAYAGLLGEEEAKDPEKPDEEPVDPPAPEPATDSLAAAMPEVVAPEGLFEPAEAAPTATLPPEPEGPVDEPLPPKEATTTETADAALLDELWGESSAEPEEPTAAPVATSPEADLPPLFEENVEPPVEAPEPQAEPQAEPPSFFDEPPADSDESKPGFEPAPAEELPLPTEPPAAETPSAAPDVETAPQPTYDRPVVRSGLIDSAATEPLPSVPVLPFNTRHLAWLLGSKLGLAELGDLDGATPEQVRAWRDEVDRLATELRIANPSSGGAPTAPPAERVRRMMDAAARAGADLLKEHGDDHAALLEIALKTNALLVVARERPDLAAPVAKAMRDAADRARLPRFLWGDTARTLDKQPTADEALDAVKRLHKTVESFLR